MKSVVHEIAVATTGLILSGLHGAVAADPVPTKITVPDMDCLLERDHGIEVGHLLEEQSFRIARARAGRRSGDLQAD